LVSCTVAWIVPAEPWELTIRPMSTAPVHRRSGASVVVVEVEVDVVDVDVEVDVVVEVVARCAA
jgi:hypothetical protein